MFCFSRFLFIILFLNTTVSVSLDNTFVGSLALLLSTKIVFSSICWTAGLFINLTSTKLMTEFMHSIQKETIKHEEFYWISVLVYYYLVFTLFICFFIIFFIKICRAVRSLHSLIFNLLLQKILYSFSLESLPFQTSHYSPSSWLCTKLFFCFFLHHVSKQVNRTVQLRLHSSRFTGFCISLLNLLWATSFCRFEVLITHRKMNTAAATRIKIEIQ